MRAFTLRRPCYAFLGPANKRRMSDLQQQLADLRARVARVAKQCDAMYRCRASAGNFPHTPLQTRQPGGKSRTATLSRMPRPEEWLGGEVHRRMETRAAFRDGKAVRAAPPARQRRYRLAGGVAGRSSRRDLRWRRAACPSRRSGRFSTPKPPAWRADPAPARSWSASEESRRKAFACASSSCGTIARKPACSMPWRGIWLRSAF